MDQHTDAPTAKQGPNDSSSLAVFVQTGRIASCHADLRAWLAEAEATYRAGGSSALEASISGAAVLARHRRDAEQMIANADRAGSFDPQGADEVRDQLRRAELFDAWLVELVADPSLFDQARDAENRELRRRLDAALSALTGVQALAAEAITLASE